MRKGEWVTRSIDECCYFRYYYALYILVFQNWPLCNYHCVYHTRSTNDLKDKNEKPFALSYMKLMQSNGTTLKNTEHDLIVYKVP